MARHSGDGKATVESCRSINVLEWQRLGYLRSPGWISCARTRGGERVASINLQAQRHAVTLKYQRRSYGENWSDVAQRIPIAWTPCRFGGEWLSPIARVDLVCLDALPVRWRAAWFVCPATANGAYCGRPVIKLYIAGRLFACRHCYQLAYVSQQEPAHRRGLWK